MMPTQMAMPAEQMSAHVVDVCSIGSLKVGVSRSNVLTLLGENFESQSQ
jgi:hypothetical protein